MILLLVCFCLIVAVSFAVLLFTFTKSASEDFEEDYIGHEYQVYNDNDDSEGQSAFKTYFFPQRHSHTRSGGQHIFQRWSTMNGASGLPVSESMITIQISPSRPTIFGDEMDEERPTVKVMLTPPTPAKEGKVVR